MNATLITEIELQGYLDGELDADRQQAVSDYLSAHPDQAARLESYRRQGMLLRRVYAPILEWPMPPEALINVTGVPRGEATLSYARSIIRSIFVVTIAFQRIRGIIL